MLKGIENIPRIGFKILNSTVKINPLIINTSSPPIIFTPGIKSASKYIEIELNTVFLSNDFIKKS